MKMDAKRQVYEYHCPLFILELNWHQSHSLTHKFVCFLC